jgi:putative oxidoreductase
MLIARIILGVVLFAHGWQKLMINGISDTYGQFEKLGIPLAIVSASFTSFVEFVGGVLIILGALTTTVVALDLVVMVGAAGFVHVTHGIFAKDGGWELVGVIVAVELALAAFGPGRYSVDDVVARRRARERADLERRRSAPVAQAPVVSAAFTPATDPRAAMVTGGFGAITPSSGVATSAFAVADAPTGAFALATPAADFAAADGPTGAFTAVAPAATGSAGASVADPAEAGSTGAFAAATAAAGSSTGAPAADPAAGGAQGASATGVPASTSAFAAVLRASAGVPIGASTTVPRASTGVPGSAFAAAPRSSNGFPTGGFAAVTPAAADVEVAEPAVDTPTTDAFPAVQAAPAEEVAPEAEHAPAPSKARRAEPSPRMASAGVHRTLSERAGRPDADAPAPFGVTVQSPLDFTPTTALPVVPPMSVETDTITVATSVPGGLPRRVRAADLPPASAVRPYA